MKKMKKLVGLLLTMVMVLSMTMTAFADEVAKTYSITINNDKEGHIYEAYQIFTGKLSGDVGNDAAPGTAAVLSDVKWGSSVTKYDGTDVTEETSATAIAETLVNASKADLEAFIEKLTLGSAAKSTSTMTDGKYVIGGLEPGYYLIKDADNSLDGEFDAYTAFIVEVLEDSTVNPKSSIPEVDKAVSDNEGEGGWGETADHQLFKTFQFKLTATLAEDVDFAEYETYKVVFKDTMSEGITFENIVSAKIDGVPVQWNELTAEEGQAGGTWTMTFNDIKAFENIDLTDGAVIEVIYNAHLNENAVVGNESAAVGNENDNENVVSLIYSNNPNAGGENDFGETEKDYVWVFTYDVENTKVDKEGPLAGAGFRLYSDADCTNEIELFFENGVYRPIDEKNANKEAVEMFSAEETGIFNIEGLDVGTYYLKETTTPAGYNTCAVIEINISADHAENEDEISAVTQITMTVDGDETDKNVVVNNKGTVLPETGGMGTTLFYVFGTILVAGAAVMLITKKRMNNAR